MPIVYSFTYDTCSPDRLVEASVVYKPTLWEWLCGKRKYTVHYTQPFPSREWYYKGTENRATLQEEMQLAVLIDRANEALYNNEIN